MSEITPLEAGLAKFVALDKGAFRGRAALVQSRQAGLAHRIVTLRVDAQDVDCRGNEPVFHAGQLCGITTSGGYGHALDASLALAYVDVQDAAMDTQLTVELLGNFVRARVVPDCPYDPENTRLQA